LYENSESCHYHDDDISLLLVNYTTVAQIKHQNICDDVKEELENKAYLKTPVHKDCFGMFHFYLQIHAWPLYL